MHPHIVPVERLGKHHDGAVTNWVLEGTITFNEASPYPHLNLVTFGLGQPSQPGSAQPQVLKTWVQPFKEAASRVSVIETPGASSLLPSLRVVVDDEHLAGVFAYSAEPGQRLIAEQKATEQALIKVVEIVRNLK